jgi:Holliday junction resolvase RusA-like endonuclease
MPRVKSATKRIYPGKKPDLDNLLKLLKDACNGIVWMDDSQVVIMIAKKVYETPTEKMGIHLYCSELCSKDANERGIQCG